MPNSNLGFAVRTVLDIRAHVFGRHSRLRIPVLLIRSPKHSELALDIKTNMRNAAIELLHLLIHLQRRIRRPAFPRYLLPKAHLRASQIQTHEPQDALLDTNGRPESERLPCLLGVAEVCVGEAVVARDVLDRRLRPGVADDFVDEVVDGGFAAGRDVVGVEEDTRGG